MNCTRRVLELMDDADASTVGSGHPFVPSNLTKEERVCLDSYEDYVIIATGYANPDQQYALISNRTTGKI